MQFLSIPVSGRQPSKVKVTHPIRYNDYQINSKIHSSIHLPVNSIFRKALSPNSDGHKSQVHTLYRCLRTCWVGIVVGERLLLLITNHPLKYTGGQILLT